MRSACVKATYVGILILMAGLIVAPGWAKSSESKPLQIFADKWAVVIGVDEFSNPSWNLQYAIKDAQDFQKYLIDDAHFARDHIKLLTGKEATQEQILKALGEWLSRAAHTDDLAVIYVRTRGTPAELDLRKQSYLAASDTNSQALFATGISMEELPRLVLQRIRAGAIVMIVDADFSGVMARPMRISPLMPYQALLPPGHSLHVICSAGSNGCSWESKSQASSVFTGNLLRALIHDGESATIPNTADSIADQVTQEVRNTRQREQQPVSMRLPSVAGDEGIPLALPPTHPRQLRKWRGTASTCEDAFEPHP